MMKVSKAFIKVKTDSALILSKISSLSKDIIFDKIKASCFNYYNNNNNKMNVYSVHRLTQCYANWYA